MSTVITKIDPKEFGLEEKKTKTIEQAFLPKVSEGEGYISIYNDLLKKEINEQTCKEAGDLRRKLVKVRTGIASIHKTEKAYHLAAGRYVDALKNKLTEPVSQMEEKLSEIEKYYEKIEAERILKLSNDRAAEIEPFLHPDAEKPINLGTMNDDFWEDYLFGAKSRFKARMEEARSKEANRLAEEKKAEEERISKEKEEAEERERIRKENERLKKEVEEKEKARLIELKAIKAKEEAAEKERQRLAKIEADKQAKIQQQLKAKAEAERQERLKAEKEAEAKRVKLENELKAKAEAERQSKQKEEERLQAELNKGDADKVKDLTADLEALKTKYSFKSAKNKKMYNDVGNLIDKVNAFINK